MTRISNSINNYVKPQTNNPPKKQSFLNQNRNRRPNRPIASSPYFQAQYQLTPMRNDASNRKMGMYVAGVGYRLNLGPIMAKAQAGVGYVNNKNIAGTSGKEMALDVLGGIEVDALLGAIGLGVGYSTGNSGKYSYLRASYELGFRGPVGVSFNIDRGFTSDKVTNGVLDKRNSGWNVGAGLRVNLGSRRTDRPKNRLF